MKKRNYIAYLMSGNSLNGTLNAHETLFEKLGEKFDKIYIINFVYLKLFSDIGVIKGKYNPKLEKNIKKPKNLEIFVPKTFKAFKNFMIDKKIIGIQNLGRNISDISVHYVLAKYNIPQVMISNIGFFNSGSTITIEDQIRKPFSVLFYYFNKKIGQKLTLLLCTLGLLKQVDIRFISDRTTLFNINKNFIKKTLFKLKLFYAKEIIEINSRTYDMSLNNTYKNTNKKIVLLDAMINHPEELRIRGGWSKSKTEKHYKNLKLFLKKISNHYNKKVCICIHPKDDIKKKKKIYKGYEVKQFETQKNIYKAFIVLFFDTSAIIDAVSLKKKIIYIVSDEIPKSFTDIGKSYATRAGIFELNIEDNFDKIKSKLTYILTKHTNNYDKYIKKYIILKSRKPSWEVVINTLKKRYFDK